MSGMADAVCLIQWTVSWLCQAQDLHYYMGI